MIRGIPSGFILGAIVCMNHFVKGFIPLALPQFRKGPKHRQQWTIHPLHLSVSLWVVWSNARLGIHPLICAVGVGAGFHMDAGWESKSWNKIIEELFSDGPCCLVTSGEGLSISCKVVYYE